jgi:hypothetical protein
MRRRPILLVAMMLALLSMARAAQAQDEAEPQEEQPAEAEPQFQMTDEQFEQWIFGKDLGETRKHLQSRLDWEINRADQMYRLTAGQKKKLEVAGRGDMKRLFDRFQEAKEQLHRARGDFNQIGPILQELQSYKQAPHAYLFGDESMLAKTLKKTLSPEQIASHEKTIYRSRVEWMVSLLDSALGLKAEQHRRFVTLIVEETPPLKRYGNFDYDALMWQASRLPRDKIKPIFDDAQLTKLLVRFGQARRMESILFGEGYLPAKLPGVERSLDAEDGSKRKAFEDRTKRGLLIGAGQTRRD